MSEYRVVNVSANRSLTRLATIVQQAADDEGLSPDTARAIAERVIQLVGDRSTIVVTPAP